MRDPQIVPCNSTRCVLDGVPRVGFYPDVREQGGKPWPEDFIFPSCLRAILEYHGDTRNDYVHLMGVSGAAFFLNWGGWLGDNAALHTMSTDPNALFTKTFEAIGYESHIVACSKQGMNAAAMRELVRSEIRAGRPCLIHGVVGPPEVCIVTGYDQDGDVLIGWSFFQAWPESQKELEFEPCGYFRKRNWEAETGAIVTVGQRKFEPERGATFRKALEWALEVACTSESWQARPNGIAAFDAWIGYLQHDEEIAHWKPGDTPASPFQVHRDATDVIAEGRWYASRFLVRETPECMPYQASFLYAAAACYAKEHELMWELWRNEGGVGRDAEVAANFATPDVRRRSIAILQQARDLDRQAAEQIQAALTALG